jgi:hypothetical protein
MSIERDLRYYAVIVHIGSRERAILVKAPTMLEVRRLVAEWRKVPIMSITEILTPGSMLDSITIASSLENEEENTISPQ